MVPIAGHMQGNIPSHPEAGESSGGFTMKQPSLSNLRRDHAGTRGIRAAAKKGSVKITINIDRDSLEILRAMAQETGVP